MCGVRLGRYVNPSQANTGQTTLETLICKVKVERLINTTHMVVLISLWEEARLPGENSCIHKNTQTLSRESPGQDSNYYVGLFVGYY